MVWQGIPDVILLKAEGASWCLKTCEEQGMYDVYPVWSTWLSDAYRDKPCLQFVETYLRY